MLVFIRTLLIFVVLIILAFIFTFVFMLRPFHRANGQIISRIWGPIVIKILGIQIEYRNLAQLDASFPSVTIANHQHNIDFFLASYILPAGTLSIVKHTLAWIPFFGQIYWLSGHFLINRSSHTKAMQTMTKVKQRLQNKEVSILIMPEGTRSHGGGMRPFKKGAFHLAIETQQKLQPMVFSSYDKTLNLNRWRPGRIIMEVLPPTPTVGKTLSDLDTLMKQTRVQMAAAIERLDAEILGSRA